MESKVTQAFPFSEFNLYEIYRYAFHYLVASGITFLCMSDIKMQRRVCLGFLEDVKVRTLFFFIYFMNSFFLL